MTKNNKTVAKLIPHQDPQDRLAPANFGAEHTEGGEIDTATLWRVDGTYETDSSRGEVTFYVLTNSHMDIPNCELAYRRLAGRRANVHGILGGVTRIEQVWTTRTYASLPVEGGGCDGEGCDSQLAAPIAPQSVDLIAYMMREMRDTHRLLWLARDEMDRLSRKLDDVLTAPNPAELGIDASHSTWEHKSGSEVRHQIICPICGDPCVHDGTPQIIGSKQAKWGGYGDLTAVTFEGESCGHRWQLCFGHHKGTMFTFTRRIEDAERGD